jgi:NAD(P)-dependent dehydrogenase (short-subunit alcohol dehydrogenase family)
VVADLDLDAALKTAAEVEGMGVRCLANRVDMADIENHRAWVTRLEWDFGPVGILVNTASVAKAAPGCAS